MFAHAISESIELRLLEARHATEFFELVRNNLERLAVWCPWLEDVETEAKTEAFLSVKLRRFAEGNGFTAGLFEAERLIGVIALEYVDHANRTTEIGYWLAAGAERRGLIMSACQHLISHAFDGLGVVRVQIRCATENARSRAIPEKLGFTQEGVVRQGERLPDRYVDLVIYGMLKDEWNSKRQSTR
jgi:ribosomal-protein-serine acetyltransferase